MVSWRDKRVAWMVAGLALSALVLLLGFWWLVRVPRPEGVTGREALVQDLAVVREAIVNKLNPGTVQDRLEQFWAGGA
ncbi:MAG: hypothetical protein HC904_11935 [Blastochloris sp.]|nr:hypothetical protein [Blastochloris sp.]